TPRTHAKAHPNRPLEAQKERVLPFTELCRSCIERSLTACRFGRSPSGRLKMVSSLPSPPIPRGVALWDLGRPADAAVLAGASRAGSLGMKRLFSARAHRQLVGFGQHVCALRA